jgi:hypothetical protein
MIKGRGGKEGRGGEGKGGKERRGRKGGEGREEREGWDGMNPRKQILATALDMPLKMSGLAQKLHTYMSFATLAWLLYKHS